MLCSPLTNSGSNSTTSNSSSAASIACKLAPDDSNNNGNSCYNNNNNNSSLKQQTLENPLRTTIREIKSRNIGSLSPLCSQTNANNLSPSAAAAAAAAVVNHNQTHASHLLIERRQAMSMERLNNIHSMNRNFRDHHKESCNGGGSLSSGGSSSTSLDENSSEEPPARATGLTRSASRVSRFKSAKEFFERLSSINHNQSTGLPNKPLHQCERPRGSVVDRYAAVTARAVKASSHANLTTISSPPKSRLQNSNHLQQLWSPQQQHTQTTPQSSPLLSVTNRPIVDTNRSASNIDIHTHSESPQSPKSERACLVFEGDNVIIGNGSLLCKRNKQLKIKFDENSTLTFEYPSEEALLADPDSPAESPTPQQKPSSNQQQVAPSQAAPAQRRKSLFLD